MKEDSILNEEKKQNVVLPKVKSTITFRVKNSTGWRKGVIHGNAGKATGKYRNYLNVENNETGEIRYYDFERDILEWFPVAKEVLVSTNFDEVSVAMAKEQELDSWKGNNMFTEVPNENQPHVTC